MAELHMAKKYTLDDLKKIHDRNYQANQTTREKAADDRIFARVTQWDDGMLDDAQLGYRGEFNLIRKATRQIIADLSANPVQVDFVAKDDERGEGVDIIDGLYLTDDRRNSSLESYDNASMECVDCGVGGWELYTDYDTNNIGDRNQVIKRRPLYEANNNSFPDGNAKRLDKSDAMNWSILEPFTKEGYQRLYEELTGEETDCAPANFASPEQSYVFPWVVGSSETYYIARIYVKEMVTEKILTFSDPFQDTIMLKQSDIVDKEVNGETVNVMDELEAQGYEQIAERKVKLPQVRMFICSGEEILSDQVVAGTEIPVVHTYGERTFVEGEEIWEGVVRLSKDPQRLRNFLLSYLGDIVSRSPRPKPIFTPEQVQGYEFMYEENGADNHFPYYLMNSKDANGNPLSNTAVGYLQAAQMPTGLNELAAETREAVSDVANAGLPNEFADPNLSGYAIEQLQARFDQQSIIYQQNLKFAKRWDAVIYAGMASVVYDAPRKVTLTGPDGERKQVTIMETILDADTGEAVTLRDLTNMEFDVYAEIGASYSSKKEKTLEQLASLASEFREVDPDMFKALNYKRLAWMDGVELTDIRAYANKQLLLSGLREPEDEEEMAMLESVQNQEAPPDPNMLLAQAEMTKAEAMMMREQRTAQKDQADVQMDQMKSQVDMAGVENDMMETQIKGFEAETRRQQIQINAAKEGVNADFTKAKTFKVQAETIKKASDRFGSRVSAQPQQMPMEQVVAEYDYDPLTGEMLLTQ